MKLMTALLNVDKTEPQSVDLESMCESLGMEYDWGAAYSNVDDVLKSYYLARWYCTDTWVGVQAIYLNDELVAMSEQTARKCSTDFKFISQEAANKIRALLTTEHDNVELIEDRDITMFYKVSFKSQLMDDFGYHKGKPVTVIRNKVRSNSITDQDITVAGEDKKQYKISVRELDIPIKTDLTIRTVFNEA